MAQDNLRTMIARIEERQIFIADSVGDIKEVINKHIDNDKVEFANIRQEIKDMNRYASSIAIVAGCAGAGLTMGWKSFKGWFS